jgi:Fic family protein
MIYSAHFLCIFEPNKLINRLMKYNWQLNSWPKFHYDEISFTNKALSFMAIAGQSIGYLNGLSDNEQAESIISLLVNEAIKTSSIEGEFISRIDVVSSIRKNLGFTTPSFNIKDKRSEGIAKLLVKVREDFESDLTEPTLFEWHKMLMLGNNYISVGKYRSHKEPMQVISGAIGKEEIHFEAPPSTKVAKEMRGFITWFNQTKPNGKRPITNLLIRAALAHLYFETIHPFEDGNGRIGRVVAEKVLAQGLNRPILMSLSTIIEANKKSYYESLKKAQRTNDVADWIHYFSDVIFKAQEQFVETIQFTLEKTKFFYKYKTVINETQNKVLYRMLEVGEGEFIWGMNATKYQSISKVSKATATRHLQDLVEKGILVSENEGRSTQYQINFK